MPITLPFALRNLTQAEFDERDRVVMGCAYSVQNDLGRLCDGQVYENALARRLQAHGMTGVHTQWPVVVSHESFQKTYRIDLLADDALYELKTVSDLVPAHDAQALHYAMLCDVNHTKLLNFRSTKVQGRLRFNALAATQRGVSNWEQTRWQPRSAECETLRGRLQSLLEDWGCFLDFRLYQEALVHFSGGEAAMRRLPLTRDGITLGTHEFKCHAANLAFHVSAVTNPEGLEPHLKRLLALTELDALQWFNLNHAQIECVTLRRI